MSLTEQREATASQRYEVSTRAIVDLGRRQLEIASYSFQLTDSEVADLAAVYNMPPVGPIFFSAVEDLIGIGPLARYNTPPSIELLNEFLRDYLEMEPLAHETSSVEPGIEIDREGVTRVTVYYPPSDVLVTALRELRLPRFGSPPAAWQKLGDLATSTSVLAVSGYAAGTGKPMLAFISPAAAFIIWLAKPSAKVMRRSLAERVAERLGTEFRPADSPDE